VVLAVLAAPISAQTLGNQSLNGKFFFRHVSLGTDITGSLTDPRSLLGTMSFDGAGHYSFTGQQVIGNNAATSQSGSGGYSIDPAGFVSLDNPQRSGAKVNARLSPGELLLGATTETADTTFDLFAAIPAPAGGAVLNGPFWTVTLEFPGGTTAAARNTIFSLNNSSLGDLSAISVTGHAANLSGGQPITQQVTGATYTLNPDGTGTVNFGAASSSALLSGSKSLYLSADGSMILGGSTATGAHDVLIGVKAASNITNASWNATSWGAGLRVNPESNRADVSDYSGSVAARGAGKLTWTRRIKPLGFAAIDFTGISPYTLNSDGTGSVQLIKVALGASGKAFVGSAIDPADPGAYEVYFGAQVPTLTGSGIFINPLGVLNAAGFAPAGNPISPGEFIALFGSGLAPSTQTAAPPYPASLNGVTVLINDTAAPIYYVSAGQINCLVPFNTHGPTATVTVQIGAAKSNTVTVPVAATAPAVYSLDNSGSGPGAILHTDFSVVNSAKPATAGETVLVFLTGMGAVTPPVADGTAGGANPPSNANAAVAVLIAGEQSTVIYNGLAPGFPGLYQINVRLPPFLLTTGPVPLAIQTPNAFHDQVDIVVK